MGLDVRFPIGFLFTAIGLALVVYGIISDPAIYQRSLGINVNLIWGGVLLAFGLLMSWLAWRARAERHAASAADATREQRVGR